MMKIRDAYHIKKQLVTYFQHVHAKIQSPDEKRTEVLS